MKKSSFPLSLAAAKKGESSLWSLGDALVKECPPDKPISEVAEYLEANGCEHSAAWLSDLRSVASIFPPKQRHLSLAFVVHQEAGSPAMLEAVIKGAPKGAVISHRFVRRVVGQIRDHEERTRREAYERAQAKREAAEAKEREKQAKSKQAKNDHERRKLEAEQREAAEETQAARREEQAARTAPRKRDLPPPAEEEVPVLVAEARFIADATEAARLGRRAKEAIAKCVGQLTAKGVAGLTDYALEAANVWTEAAQIVRQEIMDQRGHLSVMEK